MDRSSLQKCLVLLQKRWGPLFHDQVINIVAYYDVVVTVEPKKIAVAAAQEALRQANEKKAEVDALVAKLNAELAILQADF